MKRHLKSDDELKGQTANTWRRSNDGVGSVPVNLTPTIGALVLMIS